MNSRTIGEIIGLAIYNIIVANTLPHGLNVILVEQHKECSNHCKYKRMINRGELKIN